MRAVIFDVDGTLLDTTQGVLSAVRYTIEKHGLYPLSEKELLAFIGPPIQDSFARAYGLEGAVLQELATSFRDRYKGEDLFRAVPYDGIYQVCEELKSCGIVLAVATYKREDYAVRIMRHFGFDRYTELIHGADHENRLKKVDIIRRCLEDMGVSDPHDAVMIGDSDNDMIGADAVGTNFLGVTYGFGFHSREDVTLLAEKMTRTKVIGIAERPAEIMQWIKADRE